MCNTYVFLHSVNMNKRLAVRALCFFATVLLERSGLVGHLRLPFHDVATLLDGAYSGQQLNKAYFQPLA